MFNEMFGVKRAPTKQRGAGDSHKGHRTGLYGEVSLVFAETNQELERDQCNDVDFWLLMPFDYNDAHLSN